MSDSEAWVDVECPTPMQWPQTRAYILRRTKAQDDELARLTRENEELRAKLAGRKTYWPHDADGDEGSDDLDAICDGYEVGETFSVQVALMLPDEYYVMQINDKNQNDPRPATPEEIEALKADRKAENARRKAEFDRINAERFKPVKAVSIPTTPGGPHA
jgi:hypothetical protein